jgi:hypothetical protein
MKTLILLLLPIFLHGQIINIIGVNDQNTKITRFDNSTIELKTCNMYNYTKVVENINPTGIEIAKNANTEHTIYYLVNLEKKVGMMMIMKTEDICKVTSWYDGIELNVFVKPN